MISENADARRFLNIRAFHMTVNTMNTIMPKEGIDEARSGLTEPEEDHNRLFKRFCHAAKLFFSKNTGIRVKERKHLGTLITRSDY